MATKPLKIRNWQAVAAHQRNSAGAMGGSARAKNRRDRRRAKHALKMEKPAYAGLS